MSMSSTELSTFTFKALDLSGVSTRGEVEADSKQAVASQLRAKGLIVIDIVEKKGSRDVGDIMARFKRVKSRDGEARATFLRASSPRTPAATRCGSSTA